MQDKDFLPAQCKHAPIKCFCVSELWREEVKHFIATYLYPELFRCLCSWHWKTLSFFLYHECRSLPLNQHAQCPVDFSVNIPKCKAVLRSLPSFSAKTIKVILNLWLRTSQQEDKYTVVQGHLVIFFPLCLNISVSPFRNQCSWTWGWGYSPQSRGVECLPSMRKALGSTKPKNPPILWWFHIKTRNAVHCIPSTPSGMFFAQHRTQTNLSRFWVSRHIWPLRLKLIYSWQKRMYCLRRIQLEKVKIRTRNTSWTSDMPYKTKCLWAKCKWLRNIRIEFPLKCEWILKLAGKGPGNKCALNFTKPRGFEMQFKKLDKPKLWLRFSLLVSFLLSVSQRRTQWWEERGVMKGFERAHCHP